MLLSRCHGCPHITVLYTRMRCIIEVMTHAEYKELQDILASEPFKVRPRLVEFMKTVKVVEEVKPKPTRTSTQNNALWLDCELIAQKLNDAGIDWKQVIKGGGIDIPVTKDSVMEFMWRPVMQVMFSKTSTRELAKTQGEIDKIHETIMRALMEKHHIEWHDFPHDSVKTEENMSGYKTNAGQGTKGVEYPEDYKEVTAF